MSKPSLAIISSYDELCGNASYTKAIEVMLTNYFDVKVFNISTSIHSNKAAFDHHIDEICAALADYDVVNIQFEPALFGADPQQIVKRVNKVITASKNLIFTFHRIDLGASLGMRVWLEKLKSLQFWSMFREWGSSFKAKYITRKVIKQLKNRSSSEPYRIIVHRQLDAKILKQAFGDHQMLVYPLVYFSKEQQAHYLQQSNVKAWREKHGVPTDKKIIGLFGFLGQYKGHMTALQALAYLPDDYCLMVVGGQHPASIVTRKIEPTIVELLAFLTEPHHEHLIKRVFFLGSQETDDDMVAAICAADYVVLPYLEMGLNTSGIAAMAFELDKKLILSRNIAFLELGKFFPRSFETFDIGNFLELKTKILNYDQSTLAHRKTTKSAFNVEGLAQHYADLYQAMSTRP